MGEWSSDSLEDLCIIGDGNHSSKYPKKSEMVDSGVPFIRGTNIINGKLSDENVLYITTEKHEKLKKGHLKTGDVLFTNRGEIGKVAIVSELFDGANLNSQIAWLRCTKKLLPEYLFHFLQSREMRDHFAQSKSGAALQQFPIKMLKAVLITYPTIQEQERIVAILDQVFSDIEKARVTAEKNLKNARELFDSYLQQVFNSSDSKKIKLGEEIELLTGFAFKSKEYVTHEKSIPLIRGDNIVQGKLRWDGVKLWPIGRLVEFEKYELAENDIVLAMDRTWVKAGIKIAKIEKEDLPALLVQRVARLRCKDSLHQDFLYYLMRSKFFESYVLSIQTGLGVPHISGKQIQSFTFNKPSYDEQVKLVNKMSKLSSKILSLETVYKCKINSLDELKKSILQKAFSGELTKNKVEAA